MASRIVGFRATEEQIAGYEVAAKKAGMPVSEWARKLCDATAGLSSTGQPEPIDETAEQEQAIASAYPATVLEHAAKAEAPIGKSVTEFLLNTAPKIADRPDPSIRLSADGDEWEKRCVLDFGGAVLEKAFRGVPGWKKMTWEQRHAKLKEQQDAAPGDGW